MLNYMFFGIMSPDLLITDRTYILYSFHYTPTFIV